MKKIIPFLLLFLIGCISKISDFERQKIIDELKHIEKIDQKFAGIPNQELISEYGHEQAWKIFLEKRDSVGLDNQRRIKNLFSKYGYLGFNKVGKENASKFWIPIQHADNDVEFQQQMLKELEKEIKKNNAEKSNFAMLEDRVAINLKKKQRFGTQVTYNNFGQAIPKVGLVDSLNIDK